MVDGFLSLRASELAESVPSVPPQGQIPLLNEIHSEPGSEDDAILIKIRTSASLESL